MPEIVVKLGERVIHRYYFDKDLVSVGRARDNDIVIENLSVSRNHARIRREDNRYFLTDMNSANGTLVNGVRITKTELLDNDEVVVGKHSMIFLEQASEQASESSPQPTDPSNQENVTPPPAEQVARDRKGSASLQVVTSSGRMGLLTVTQGKQSGQQFPLQKNEVFIGRASENDIRIHDWFVAKKHARITRDGDQFAIKDLDSWRGTTLNGNTIKESALVDGSEIVFGTTVLSFKLVDSEDYFRSHPKPTPPADDALYDESSEGWESSDKINKEEVLKAGQFAEEAGLVAEPSTGAFATEENSTDDVDPLADLPSEPNEDSLDGLDEDDEYAPFTEDELEALERDSDIHDEGMPEDEEARRLAWEMHDAEKLFGMESESEQISLEASDEDLSVEEEAAVDAQNALEGLQERADQQIVSQEVLEQELIEEQEALEGSVEQPAAEKEPETESSSSGDQVDEATSREVRMWEKALANKSPLIRRNAARELKKLTGRAYDWESKPTGQ